MVSPRTLALALTTLLVLALVTVLPGSLGALDTDGLWREIALPALVLAGGACLMPAALLGASLARVRNRARRATVRYQLVLSQADEAGPEQVAGACEQLVQTVRESLSRRVTLGQPWVALESWFLPAQRAGETGTAALVLLCEPRSLQGVLGALRHAYPDLAVRTDAAGLPLALEAPSFVPAHVLRVRKARQWALPLGNAGAGQGGGGARSTVAAIMRRQQHAGRVSCVRWCLLPAADQLDGRAAERLASLGRADELSAARANEIRDALQSAGGAMSFLELQAAVEPRSAGGDRAESFRELQGRCRELLSPALSQRGPNHLTERLMCLRQRLYRRRWATGEPPLLATGATLVSPRELALLMELPSLGSEHALPLQRNTVPNLPIPAGVPRARQLELALPPADCDTRESTGAAPEGGL